MRMTTIRPTVVAMIVLALALTSAAARAGEAASITEAYRQRLEFVRANVPAITAAAEAVATRWIEKKQVLLHYPFGGDCSNFSMEFCSRAGGLDNARTNTVRVKERSANDVIVYAPRSWEKGLAFVKADGVKHHEEGWLIVVFGSKAGAPAQSEVPIDILIDNGAKSGGEDEAALNQIVNMTNGWIWTCELAAALTRHGVHPGVLRGMPLPGSREQLKQYQTGLPTLYPCDSKIAPGELAKAYLAAVEESLKDLESERNLKQIGRAAEMAAAHLAAGKSVWMTSMTHVLDGEVFVDNAAPTKAFRGISCGPHGETFLQNAKQDDLLFYFGEWSLNLPWFDYLKVIRETKADFILGFRPTTEPTEGWDHPEIFWDQKVDDAAMVLEQRWPFDGAVVSVPFNPGKMAPITGVYLCLQYRQLDAAIAHKAGTGGPGAGAGK